VTVTVRDFAIVLDKERVTVLESVKTAEVGVSVAVPESLTVKRAGLGAVVESVSL
jgi:hypothetical protein